MKQKIITLRINKANAGQLLTLACELRIMARSWKKFGPEIEVLAGKLKELKHGHKANLRKWQQGGWAASAQAVDKLASLVQEFIGMKKSLILQIALALKHPELFPEKELKKLMEIKNLIFEKMYTEYVKKRNIKTNKKITHQKVWKC